MKTCDPTKYVENACLDALKSCFGLHEIQAPIIKNTSRDFEGDLTILTFPLAKLLKKSPESIGNTLGEQMMKQHQDITDFNVAKGFLNVSLSDAFWLKCLHHISQDNNYGTAPRKNKTLLVEYSSPNTNKPLHLGHIRNILLGWSIANILDAAGYDIVRTQIINDRGIAICKSMLAWKLFGNNKTPKSEKIKGDLFVGQYYVLFEQKLKEEYEAWQKTSLAQSIFEQTSGKSNREQFFKKFKNTYFNEYSNLGKQTRQMLLDWENQDPETVKLWKQMRRWVLEGFEQSYQALGVRFDKNYFESKTYLAGKNIVLEGLKQKLFYQKNDGSIWIDLEEKNLGQKILLRADGTSVYITQDLGTAELRYQDYQMDGMIYVVGNEQDYHFQALFETLKTLKKSYAEKLYHLSYGMVDLPDGKMKSREGTVVDADDLIREVISEAEKSTAERGVLADLDNKEISRINTRIGLAALKFFILKVQAKKRMVFNPKESVDLQGQTGPYVQNAYVRIQSVKRKAELSKHRGKTAKYQNLNSFEKELIKQLLLYPKRVKLAAKTYEPSEIANYAYQLAKAYHRFYHEVKILSDPDQNAIAFRLYLSEQVGRILQSAFKLLGIDMPDKM